MKSPSPLLIAALLMAVTAPAWAVPTAAELREMESVRTLAEAEARQEIETLFSRLCPGRCELINVTAKVSQPKAAGFVTPGFDAPGQTSSVKVELTGLESRIMIDASLPKQFRNNITPMLRYRLSKITPSVVISPVVLEFPKPQLEPFPEPPEEPEEEPKAEEPPKEDPPKEEPPKEDPPKVEEPDPKPEPSWLDRLLKELIPWLPYALMLILLAACTIALLNKLRELLELQNQVPVAPGGDDGDTEPGMPDVDALRQELRASRAVQNEVLRGWIQDDPEGVATLVRMLGPEILADLKNDASLRASIEVVSGEVAAAREPISAAVAVRVAREARSRITAARVLQDEQGLKGDWEFLEGLTVAQVQRVMGSLGPAEKGYAIGQLPSGLRSAYMEQMDPGARQELFLSAGSSEALTRDQAIDLAARLRRGAEEVSHLGGEASGQALMILEMLRALPLAEQIDTLRTMRQRRPEVAQAVLSSTVLESTALHLPPEVIGDTMQRMQIERLASFLRGTRDDVREHMMGLAPSTIRGPLLSEMDLGIPVSRSDFLEARTEVLATIESVARRDGIDLASANGRALEQA